MPPPPRSLVTRIVCYPQAHVTYFYTRVYHVKKGTCSVTGGAYRAGGGGTIGKDPIRPNTDLRCHFYNPMLEFKGLYLNYDMLQLEPFRININDGSYTRKARAFLL